MNITQLIKASRTLVMRSALGLVTVAMLGAGNAQAATVTNTFDLGSGISIEQHSFTNWIAKGTLPLGSILRSVSVDAVLESTDNYNWADDLTIYLDPTPETPGEDGLLQVGGYDALGSPVLRVGWSNGQTDPVSPVTDTKFAGVDFPDDFDLSTMGLFLANGYGGAGYYGVWSGLATVTYDVPAPANIFIMNFGIYGMALIDQGTAQITITLPFGADVTSLAPTYVLSTDARCYSNLSCTAEVEISSGTQGNFTDPVHYFVVSSDNLITNDYVVTVTVTPANKDCDILAFGPGGVIDQETRTIVWYVPEGSNLETLAPTYTLSPFATCPQPNGGVPTPDFSAAPVPYIVQAQAGGSKEYTVTLAYSPLPIWNGLACWFDASVGVTEDESGVLTWNDQSGLGHNATRASGTPLRVADQLNGKPAVQFRQDHFTLAEPMLTVQQYLVLKSPDVFWNGGGAFLAPDGGQTDRIYAMFGGLWGGAPGCFGGFWTDPPPAGVSRNGVVIAPQTGNNFAYPVNPINEYMLLKINVNTNQYVGSRSPASYLMGKASNLGYIDFDVCEIIAYDHVLSAEDEAKVGGFLANKYGLVTAYTDLTPQAQMLTFGLFGAPAATINEAAKTISFIVPSTANVSALAPAFTISADATCDHGSGNAYNFSSPVHYIVHNATDTIISDYTVTVNSVAPSGIINLNIDSTTWPGLVGPAGGLGTTWNTRPTSSGSSLFDSTGFTTGVGYTSSGSSWDGPDTWSYPNLHMLKRGFRNFDISESNWQQLMITGLAVGKRYDLYIASANCSDQYSKGVWSTPNDTTTPGDHPCDNTSGINGDTWVEGNNYVSFKDVKPDGSGQIIFNGHSLDGYRLPLSGFQIVELPPKGTVLLLW